MQDFFLNIRRFLARLTLGQQMALGLVLAGVTAILITIAYWANQPDYTLLFGELDPADANSVVETLREEGVSYELKSGGTAVYVPHNKVYELRLRFASEGTISKGQIGYELFDRDNLGMTDFMQKMNKKRALEGELARTITNIQQVEMARVHLVLPERSPFRSAEVEASASVVLQPAGSGSLNQRQIEGITALVAGAVEGMSNASVTVIDAQGNMLSDPDAGDPNVSLTSTQLEMQREVEKHLAENGQSMLNQMLGAGEAIVRVSAKLDFSRRVSERSLIDPESRTVISEEELNEEGPEDAAESTVRNYELSRTQERFESSVGDISYLTVSVMLNHKRAAANANAEGEGEQPAQREPYTDEELQEIESLVKNAVGFDPDRGDRFAIHQTRFDTSVDDKIVAELQDQDWQRQMEMYLRYGLILLGLLVGAWLVRSIAKRGAEMAGVSGELEAAGSSGGSRQLQDGSSGGGAVAGRTPQSLAEGPPVGGGAGGDEEEMMLVDDVYTSKLSAQAKARLKAKNQMYEEIQSQVVENPEETAELIRSWLVNDATKQQV
jgi:flagellar M-ring protein FliF